jgi:hypothetical protein
VKIKYFFPVAILIFVFGLVTFLTSANNHHGPIESFQLTHVRYWKSNPEKRTVIVRIVNSQGKSLEKMLASDGSDFKQALVEHDLSDFSDNRADTKSEYFVRTEQLFGLTAYVYRYKVGDGVVVERWLSTKTGFIPLKQIIEEPNGEVNITETANLEFREVSDKEIEANPDILIELPSQLRQ